MWKSGFRSLDAVFLRAFKIKKPGKYLGLSKSAVSRAATRGQKLIVDQFLSLKD